MAAKGVDIPTTVAIRAATSRTRSWPRRHRPFNRGCAFLTLHTVLRVNRGGDARPQRQIRALSAARVGVCGGWTPEDARHSRRYDAHLEPGGVPMKLRVGCPRART